MAVELFDKRGDVDRHARITFRSGDVREYVAARWGESNTHANVAAEAERWVERLLGDYRDAQETR